MPRRDHFHPPVSKRTSWEAVHGMWPACIVRHLRSILPTGYIAAPRVHLGAYFEVEGATYVTENSRTFSGEEIGVDGNGGTTTALWAPPKSAVDVQTDIEEDSEYQVRIYDSTGENLLVATIEIVSPANKDRPEKRNAFIGKCAALLKKGIAVSIVDLVTIRHGNLYAQLLEFLGHSDSTLSNPPPDLYAVSLRRVEIDERTVLQTWPNSMTIGQPLPTLPLWLSANLVVPLNLEISYEAACHDLWIS